MPVSSASTSSRLRCADTVFDVGMQDRKRAEVMLADQDGCGPSHLLHIERAAMMIDVAVNERAYDGVGPHAVMISLLIAPRSER